MQDYKSRKLKEIFCPSYLHLFLILVFLQSFWQQSLFEFLGSTNQKIILTAWSTNLVSTCCLPVTKGITNTLIICQFCLSVMVGQHVLTKCVLQAVDMIFTHLQKWMDVTVYFILKAISLMSEYPQGGG